MPLRDPLAHRQTDARARIIGCDVKPLKNDEDASEIFRAREGLSECKIHNNLHIVDDGVKAMAFLRRQGEYGIAPRPDLILLDLNLPRKDGREVLREIKEDELLKVIPVVVLTTSKAEEDIIKSYSLHANCYVTKPLGLQQFLDVVRSIEDFWFTIVRLPPK
jgi:chemotaxis family two-component system response regulator Rcp1